MNDIIVFSSCYLPQNSVENYQYIMDHLFRYVTLFTAPKTNHQRNDLYTTTQREEE